MSSDEERDSGNAFEGDSDPDTEVEQIPSDKEDEDNVRGAEVTGAPTKMMPIERGQDHRVRGKVGQRSHKIRLHSTCGRATRQPRGLCPLVRLIIGGRPGIRRPNSMRENYRASVDGIRRTSR